MGVLSGTLITPHAGSVLGAAVSIGVAWFVLRRTLESNQEQFRSQLAKEREHAIEQRRIEAFGDLIAELNGYLRFPVASEPLTALQRSSDAALQRWMLYVIPGHSSFRDDMAFARTEVVHRAEIRASEIRDAERDVREGHETKWTYDPPIQSLIADVVRHGREWHAGDDEAKAVAAAWFHDRFTMWRGESA